jgi:E3 ubiquitin-protein ligase NEDD4
MNEFRQGFNEVVPIEKIEIFNENELELLLCGVNEVDVNDWKENTDYTRGYFQNHPIILWFWEAVLSFTAEERLKLLQFVTGTPRVPVDGFKGLRQGGSGRLFTIERWGKSDHLPRAHTCFNRIDLPPYTSYTELKAKLKSAIELSECFAFV